MATYSSPSPSPPFNFLALPAELRIKIYKHLVPTYANDKPPSTYAGLRLTNRQIRSEFDHEFLKAHANRLKKLVAHFSSRLQEIRRYPLGAGIYDASVLIPNTMLSAQTLNITIPVERTFLMKALNSSYVDHLIFKNTHELEIHLSLSPMDDDRDKNSEVMRFKNSEVTRFPGGLNRFLRISMERRVGVMKTTVYLEKADSWYMSGNSGVYLKMTAVGDKNNPIVCCEDDELSAKEWDVQDVQHSRRARFQRYVDDPLWAVAWNWEELYG